MTVYILTTQLCLKTVQFHNWNTFSGTELVTSVPQTETDTKGLFSEVSAPWTETVTAGLKVWFQSHTLQDINEMDKYNASDPVKSLRFSVDICSFPVF